MSFAWMSNPQYLAQVGHYLGGASLLLTTGLFSLAAGAGWRPVILTLAVGVFAASVKEFVFDVASWGDMARKWAEQRSWEALRPVYQEALAAAVQAQ